MYIAFNSIFFFAAPHSRVPLERDCLVTGQDRHAGQGEGGPAAPRLPAGLHPNQNMLSLSSYQRISIVLTPKGRFNNA